MTKKTFFYLKETNGKAFLALLMPIFAIPWSKSEYLRQFLRRLRTKIF
jgi:hypothetical protein